jgi:hypothetical protein
MAVSFVAMLGGMVCAFIGSYYGIRAAGHRSPDAPRRWMVVLNRWNAAWFADQLDEIGLAYRRRMLKFQRVAIASFIAMAALVTVLAFAG